MVLRLRRGAEGRCVRVHRPVTARALAQQTGAPFLTAEDISAEGVAECFCAHTGTRKRGGVKRPAAQAAGQEA